eukprot:355224-Chlamydomonas_euryale.AAC.1
MHLPISSAPAQRPSHSAAATAASDTGGSRPRDGGGVSRCCADRTKRSSPAKRSPTQDHMIGQGDAMRWAGGMGQAKRAWTYVTRLSLYPIVEKSGRGVRKIGEEGRRGGGKQQQAARDEGRGCGERRRACVHLQRVQV